MKRLIFLAVFILTGSCGAQIQYPYILLAPSDPTGNSCGQAPQLQTVYSSGNVYSCKNGVMAIVGGGGGSGTVTSVTGTANQIDVATGTTTPVLSLDPALILPTGATLVAPVLGTPASGVITNLTGTCTSCNANIAGATAQTISVAGAANVSPLLLSGVWETGGSVTTNYPALYIRASGASDGALSTVGTGLVINAATGCTTGQLMTGQVNGAATVFSVNCNGTVTSAGGFTSTSGLTTGTAGNTQNAATTYRAFNAGGFVWSSTNNSTGTIDTTLCRQGAGVVEVGSSTGCASSGTLQAASVAIQGARKGTFICTGGGTITISNAAMAATSLVIISMNAQGGTITTPPAMKTVTGTSGFTVLCGATDTSTYNYAILD